ncbi:hypothetical protein [Lysobacter enzymogenes]|jgi:hypothetical protein|uniref:hypothetical protein n=1 Tax=Lysobacter enzymogenes TaxID=69 RepID=UPI00110FF440|nr:hypothetical protein [Lysobacter enzymogenes]QCW27560.1 hypothetical protein FE772_19855 [Lysobacter enzymogenes]UZW61799.1 hypothetical protein BV903_005735 [Lysobacter enzymogenes]
MSLDIMPTTPTLQAPAVRGAWQNVRWRPNPSTGEVLNLGVVFRAINGDVHVRMLDYFDRVKCLYDSRLAGDAKFLITVAKEALLVGAALPTDNVFLSDEKFASGASAEAIVASLFSATVPLAAPKTSLAAQIESKMSQNTDSVREQVLGELKRLSGVDASRIINSEQVMLVNDGLRVHSLDIPLQSSKALGTIVSARFSNIRDTELHMLRADNDLQIARRLYLQNSLFMYVVRHDGGANVERVDALLDNFSWKFEKVGVQMKSYTDPALVAPDIVEDMPLAN